MKKLKPAESPLQTDDLCIRVRDFVTWLQRRQRDTLKLQQEVSSALTKIDRLVMLTSPLLFHSLSHTNVSH